MAHLTILCVPVLDDNYVWIAHETESGETVVIDPAVADPILDAAAKQKWRITQIWNTHWHEDHVGGNAGIKAATGALVTVPAKEAGRIGGSDIVVAGGDCVSIGTVQGVVIDVPGHTAGHIAYHLPSEAVLFPGDTLFAMGCGRLFEGTAEQMWGNLETLARLPAETRIYSAHEYTESNGRYALVAEPENEDIRERMTRVRDLRARRLPTLPTTIAEERRTNPFIRAGSVAEFATRRAAKDAFR